MKKEVIIMKELMKETKTYRVDTENEAIQI